MNYRSLLIGVLFVVSAITGYITFESRLHNEFKDYREHIYLECFHCHSLAWSISLRKYNYLKWTSDDYCGVSPPSPWSVTSSRDQSSAIVYMADATCKHMWERQLVDDKDVWDGLPIYFMPFKLHQVQKLATCLFYILSVLILTCLVHLFLISKAKIISRNVGFITLWGLMSALVLVFCTVFPVGVPLTAFLREYSVLSKRLSESPAAMGTRVKYLLSNEAINEIAKSTIEIIPPNYTGGVYWWYSSFLSDSTFPFKYWKRAQARLAVAVAQHDPVMAGRFFYGPDFTDGDNLTNLTARLDKQLVNLNERAIGYEKPLIKKVIIRGEGVVDVLWTEYEMPRNFFFTTYKSYDLDDKKIWIPIRNVCKGRYYAGHFDCFGKVIIW